jgi:phage shock protein C
MNENTTTQAPNSVRVFRRSTDDRMIAGVCGGAARMFGIDSSLLRVILVAATILGVGAGALVYLVCWLVVPEEG